MSQPLDLDEFKAALARHPAVFDRWVVEALIAEVERLRAALRYISSPTQGYNDPTGEVTPEEFARAGFRRDLAPSALATCIRIATDALADIEPL